MNDYFHQRLELYLKEVHPDLVRSMEPADYSAFLTTRTQNAAEAFEQARRTGLAVGAAEELAFNALFSGIDSNYPFLADFIEAHFLVVYQRLQKEGQLQSVLLDLAQVLYTDVTLLRQASGKEKTLREYALIGTLETCLSEHGF